MANEYFVNSADLTSVADAIRAKGETTETLVFPGGFVAAIAGMETGKTGATLTVTTPAEGITVTVSKGELSYTKTTGADGTAVISGLESGTWTITISDGSQTATGTVNIDADYAANMTFFAATINVTYPAGSVCTATDGVTTLTAPDTSGTWACIVPNVGAWTVMCYDGSDYDSSENKKSKDVEITSEGQSESVDLNYRLYIYNRSSDFESRFGGSSYIYKSPTSGNSSGYANFETDKLHLRTYGPPGGVRRDARTTNLKVSSAGYTKLVVIGNLKYNWKSSTHATGLQVVVHDTQILDGSFVYRSQLTEQGDFTVILEVPQEGEYYYWVNTYTYTPEGTTQYAEAYVYEIYLE